MHRRREEEDMSKVEGRISKIGAAPEEEESTIQCVGFIFYLWVKYDLAPEL